MTDRPSGTQDVPARGLAEIAGTDPAENCVAHLLLAVFACHLRTSGIAQHHMRQTLATIDAESHRRQTLRNPHATRIVRVVTQAKGQVVSLRLPVIDDAVVMPSLDFKTILASIGDHRRSATPMTLHDIEIDRVGLRLRTTRMRDAITQSLATSSLAKLADEIGEILAQCALRCRRPSRRSTWRTISSRWPATAPA